MVELQYNKGGYKMKNEIEMLEQRLQEVEEQQLEVLGICMDESGDSKKAAEKLRKAEKAYRRLENERLVVESELEALQCEEHIRILQIKEERALNEDIRNKIIEERLHEDKKLRDIQKRLQELRQQACHHPIYLFLSSDNDGGDVYWKCICIECGERIYRKSTFFEDKRVLHIRRRTNDTRTDWQIANHLGKTFQKYTAKYDEETSLLLLDVFTTGAVFGADSKYRKLKDKIGSLALKNVTVADFY